MSKYHKENVEESSIKNHLRAKNKNFNITVTDNLLVVSRLNNCLCKLFLIDKMFNL